MIITSPAWNYPPKKKKGIWDQRHLRYIREHKRVFYTNLLTNGKLQNHLADVEEQAQELSMPR